MLMKQKFLGLMFASLFMVACSSNDTKDDSSTSGTDINDSDVTAVTGLGDGQPIDNAGLEGSDLQGSDLDASEFAGSSIEGVAKNMTIYYFAFDQYALDDEMRQNLDMVASALKQTTMNIRLEGHADERGSREYNLALSEKRAKTIKKYLTVQGVDGSRIETVGYGEEKPQEMGAHDLNRRVEFVK